MNSDFILDLQRKRSNYSHPDQATSQANSLILLSSGIYTEEERFVFELLQNAVDAHSITSSCLDVKIMLEDDYLIFMHNGDAFTERDIEGLCDVGNGNKMTDVKKIGYKGIGFKSVFMRSTNVTVQSGGYCFMFDKHHWNNYWDLNWNTSEYGVKDNEKRYSMPWQIIPIETDPPVEIDADGYNVITFIKLVNRGSIEQKILNLFENNQFLLFLKSENLKMSFWVDGESRSNIEKVKEGDKVILLSNGNESSKWLLYINDKVEVPSELKDSINSDINTPDKLKYANTFDLSFAIALDKNNQLRRLTKEESFIYTYLPTSYRFGSEGFPFLVNANFITDAGRQQLHKDSEWNKLIFSKIPSEFLTWIKTLSTVYKNYWEVLPDKSYGSANSLELIYEINMKKAIDEIAFIPCAHDSAHKLLAADAFMDRMGIAEAVSLTVLVDHINRTYKKTYKEHSQVTNIWRGSRILSSYGVFIFDKQKLNALFDDKSVFDNLTTSLDVKLIDFLYEYYHHNNSEQEELMSILKQTNFLLDENIELYSPKDLFFPSSYKEQNQLADGAHILHEDIYTAIKNKPELLTWLTLLGVETLSDITFINNVICRDGYVTNDNAIEIGRFIFNVYQKEDLLGKVSQFKLNHIPFLTKRGNLKCVYNLYLSSEYKPELNLESIFDEDIFISDEYCDDESFAEWKVFLLKMGAKEDISNTEICIQLYGTEYNNRYDKRFFDAVKKASEKYGWISYEGWSLNSGYGFSGSEVYYHTVPFLYRCAEYSFSKLVFSRLLSKFIPDQLNTKVTSVHGSTGFYTRSVTSSMLSEVGCKLNHFKWVIENCPVIPTVKQDCRQSIEVYSNTIPNIDEIAGCYLPIIDVDGEVSDEWQRYLDLKKHLTIEDYLYLLREFANDPSNAIGNKSRISIIYQKLVEFGVLDSESYRKQLIDWAKNNSILTEDGKFVPPSELSYITLDGFSSKNRVYVGTPSHKEKVIELLALMGVKIITSESIEARFESKTESYELKKILKDKVSILSLLASGEDANVEKYSENKIRLLSLIQNTYYFHCKSISLSYGDSDDVISKHTFGNNNEFYYTGELRPASIEPLLLPLCKYLDIRGKERELFIMFFETLDAIKQNLKDKGYNVDLIEDEPVIDSGTINVRLDYHPDESAQQRNMLTGFKGEILVYDMLTSMGYLPQCNSISLNEDEYHTHCIEMNGKLYFCRPNYDKYDISFVSKNGKEIYIEVKATTMSKTSQENMPISYRELSMVEECASCFNKKYFIVRVFDIDTTHPDVYIFNGNLLSNENLVSIIEQ